MHYITNTKSLFYRSLYSSWKNLGLNLPSALTSDCFNPQEIGYQASGWGGGVGNSEIIAIPNRYKDTLDELIDILDLEFPDWVGPIDERSRNISIFEGSLTELSKWDCLDEDLPDRLSRLAPKTRN